MLFDIYQKHSLFEKKFVLSLYTSCSDNAGFKIIIFSRLDIFDRTVQPMCVSKVKPSQEDEMFCTVMKYSFRDSCSFPYIKTLLKVSEPVFEQNPE